MSARKCRQCRRGRLSEGESLCWVCQAQENPDRLSFETSPPTVGEKGGTARATEDPPNP